MAHDQSVSSDSDSGAATATQQRPGERLHTIPVGVYLAAPVGDEVQIVEEALNTICDRLGFEMLTDNAPIIGSWIHRWLCRSKEAVTSHEVTKRLRQLEEALQLQILGKPQSEMDAALLKGVAEVLKATEQDDLVIHVGLVFAVRWLNPKTKQRQTIIKSLTPEQFSKLQQSDSLLQDPEAMFQLLKQSDFGGASGIAELPRPIRPFQPGL